MCPASPLLAGFTDRLVVPGAEEDVTREVRDSGAATTGVGSRARRCPRAGRRRPRPVSHPDVEICRYHGGARGQVGFVKARFVERLRPDWTGVGERLS